MISASIILIISRLRYLKPITIREKIIFMCVAASFYINMFILKMTVASCLEKRAYVCTNSLKFILNDDYMYKKKYEKDIQNIDLYIQKLLKRNTAFFLYN